VQAKKKELCGGQEREINEAVTTQQHAAAGCRYSRAPTVLLQTPTALLHYFAQAQQAQQPCRARAALLAARAALLAARPAADDS
jgi:hypothetical protein